jgi:hypothetical protein
VLPSMVDHQRSVGFWGWNVYATKPVHPLLPDLRTRGDDLRELHGAVLGPSS